MADKLVLHEPHLGGNEWNYIKQCLDTNWISSSGEYVDLFEESIASYTLSDHSVSCVNGTAALQIGLSLLGVRPNDEVIVPTITFIATVNAIHYNGAHPVFMDVDSIGNIDSEKTIEFIKQETVFRDGCSHNKVSNRKISAIVLVHVYFFVQFVVQNLLHVQYY